MTILKDIYHSLTRLIILNNQRGKKVKVNGGIQVSSQSRYGKPLGRGEINRARSTNWNGKGKTSQKKKHVCSGSILLSWFGQVAPGMRIYNSTLLLSNGSR